MPTSRRVDETAAAVYTKDYYLETRKKELLPFAAVGTGLRIIIPRETRQADRDRHHMISLLRGIE